ncbi:MAG: hypothetical protein D3916_10890 [Candidatus Electrothrix sp. MAN1_4]|nr:hypothetical protein [Candidatus Electrothrix sp. MAN1_4]
MKALTEKIRSIGLLMVYVHLPESIVFITRFTAIDKVELNYTVYLQKLEGVFVGYIACWVPE